MKLAVACILLCGIETAAVLCYLVLSLLGIIEKDFCLDCMEAVSQHLQIFQLCRCILVCILYAYCRVTKLWVLGLIAWISTILLGGKIALLVLAEYVSSDGKILLHPVGLPRFLLTAGVILFCWIEFLVSIIVSRNELCRDLIDAGDTDAGVLLPPTSIFSPTEPYQLQYKPTLASARPTASTPLLINSSYDEVKINYSSPDNNYILLDNSGAMDVLSDAVLQHTKASKSVLLSLSMRDDEPISVPTATPATNDDSNSPLFVMPSISRLAALMLDEKKGIALTEHSGFFRTYRECFSGKDAVDWLIQTLNGGNIERSNASIILQKMIDEEYLQCLTNSEQRFIDSASEYYTFRDNSRVPRVSLDMSPAPTQSDSSIHNHHPVNQLPSEVQQLVDALREGVPIRDRRLTHAKNKQTQIHPRCFLGSEAMDWLTTHVTHSESESRDILNSLLRGGVIYDISHDVGQAFSKQRYYRFREYDNHVPIYAQQSPSIEIDMLELSNLAKKLQARNGVTSSTKDITSEKLVKSHTSPMLHNMDNNNNNRTKTTPIKSPTKSQQNKPVISQSLMNFLMEMREERTGVPTTLRKLKSTNSQVISFSGSDAVTWLVEAKQLQTREHAVKMLTKILKTGVIFKHMTQNAPEDCFVDSNKVYYYFEDIPQPPSSNPSPNSRLSQSLPSHLSNSSPLDLSTSYGSYGMTSTSSSFSSSYSSGFGSFGSSPGFVPLLHKIATAMKDPVTGIKLKDETVGVSSTEAITYHNCFSGSDAVEWLCKVQGVERSHAARILQALVENRSIISLTDVVFLGSNAALYKFYDQ